MTGQDPSFPESRIPCHALPAPGPGRAQSPQCPMIHQLPGFIMMSPSVLDLSERSLIPVRRFDNFQGHGAGSWTKHA
ncbi:hypothetical protein BO82DRAFT_356475 [Aspergillus uvarum CBS 121591]|uniref:Uncharacterized protein n=1 Tax=Aspergillus uvarum CBS 121591 TaxID=1448315 RepID=A0A319CUM7_9EURO|nr:hypothetical protein BO82DRAFT_356475 [Aspergillus uvarum CBS 121591]PYH79308.1 hypothetical protein BO82DRAFT_356475 [Aspergillus uvarum CBS 121591]